MYYYVFRVRSIFINVWCAVYNNYKNKPWQIKEARITPTFFSNAINLIHNTVLFLG